VKGIAQTLKRPAQKESNLVIVSATTMGKDFKIIRIQLEGMAGSGKSHMILQIIKHMHEVMKIKLEDIKMCFIDCDKKGIAPLLYSQTIPTEYQDCIRYAKCENIWEVYEATDIFEKELRDHKAKTGVDGWLVIENMGEVWYYCQRDYVEAAYDIPYVQLLMEKQEEAVSRGKKTLPALDQMLDYRNINPLHNEWANRISNGDYNLLWTCHEKTRKFQKGDEEVEVVAGAGQKDNDARVDFILRMYNDKGKFYLDSRKLRSLSLQINKEVLKENSFTTFINKFYSILEIDCKRRKIIIPDFIWNKKLEPTITSTKTTDKKKKEVAKEEKVEEDSEEIEI
jgi:Ni2+-binding GTPase involved in maturation of urease and hydrogenase